LHQRTLNHFCPITLNRQNVGMHRVLPLFTNFLLDGKMPGHREVFSIYIAVHEHEYVNGYPVVAGHMARLPLWSDYLIVEIERQPLGADLTYAAKYSWASLNRSPDTPMPLILLDGGSRADADVPVPERAYAALGPTAKVHLETRDWN